MSKQPHRYTAFATLLHELHGAGLTLTQCLLLYEIARLEDAGEPAHLTSLCAALEMPFSTASRVAWSLVEAGWLEQRAVPGDRRARRLVVVTPLPRLSA